MPLRPPPIQDITLLETNKFSVSWTRWLQQIYNILGAKEPLPLASYTVATLPSASGPPSLIYVSNESGGAIPAFNDGTNWRRVSDRAIVT